MYYEIRVMGHLDEQWVEWFDPLAIANVESGEAILAGELVDQAALHGMLIRVRDLGLTLIAVQQGKGAGSGNNADAAQGGEGVAKAKTVESRS